MINDDLRMPMAVEMLKQDEEALALRALEIYRNINYRDDKNEEIVIFRNSVRSSMKELTLAVLRLEAMIAVNNMRLGAAENGYLTDEEIEEEIQASRRERKARA